MERKIDAIIIGAQKAGTTSLNAYLGQHPDVLGHPQLEFAYFESDQEYNEGFSPVFKRYFTNGNANAPLVLAKSAAIYSSPKALQRLHAHNPDCNVIFLLREPVSRAVSAYNMEVFNGTVKRPFEDIPEVINNEIQDELLELIVRRGLYADHLNELLHYFDRSQIHLVLYDDLRENPEKVVRDTFQHLGLDTTFQPDLSVLHNVTRKAKSSAATSAIQRLRSDKNILKRLAKKVMPYRAFSRIGQTLIERNKSSETPEPLSQETLDWLHQYFSEPNRALQRISGLDISHWNKLRDTH